MLNGDSTVEQGERSDLNNYRPISVTPIVAKVFERIIYDQLYGYLTQNDLISSHQSGFRSLHSMVTALLHATDNWAFNIDRGNVNAVVFLDLKKYLTPLTTPFFCLNWKPMVFQALPIIYGLNPIFSPLLKNVLQMVLCRVANPPPSVYLRELF